MKPGTIIEVRSRSINDGFQIFNSQNGRKRFCLVFRCIGTFVKNFRGDFAFLILTSEGLFLIHTSEVNLREIV